MHLTATDYIIWLAGPILQFGVLVTMFRRGLYKDYPYFFNYTILQVVSEPILYGLHRYSDTLYFYTYYVNIALSVLISFAVLQEIFKDAFRPYEALRDLSVILFRWSALVVLLVGVMWAINANHRSDDGGVINAIMLGERAVRLMQCGLVFFLLLFSEYLGISRRSLLFGISLGFGFFAAINMLVVTGMAQHGGILSKTVLRHINSAAYFIAIAIWLGYTMVAVSSESAAAEEAMARSKDIDNALQEARIQPPADGLLDGMERTVERLLYPREESKISVSASHS
jgi:hypothetical protein